MMNVVFPEVEAALAKRGKRKANEDAITVTQRMTQAGADACVTKSTLHEAVAVSYRAMRAIDPEIKILRRELKTMAEALLAATAKAPMESENEPRERESLEELRASLRDERAAIDAWRAELDAAVAASAKVTSVTTVSSRSVVSNPFREFPTDRRRLGAPMLLVI